jgi:hypothetical protein
MIDRQHALPVTQQCRLVAVARSSVYYALPSRKCILHVPAKFHPRTSCSHPLVVMMEFTHFRESEELALSRLLYRTYVRVIHGQRKVRPPAMVVVDVTG